MVLENADLSEKEKKNSRISRFLAIVFTVITSLNIYFAFCDAYQYPRHTFLVFLCAILFCIIFDVIFFLPARKSLLGAGIVFLVYIILILSNLHRIISQIKDIMQYVQCRVDVYYGLISSPKEFYIAPNEYEGIPGQLFILAILFIVVFLMMLGVKSGTRFFVVWSVLAAMILVMLYGKTPSQLNAVMLFLGALALCALAQAREDVPGEESAPGKRYSLQQLRVFAVILVLSLLAGKFFYSIYGEELMRKHEYYQRKQLQAEKKIEKYLTAQLGKIRFGGQSAKLDNSEPNQAGKRIMRVRTNAKPENSIYFRAESADTYEDNEWKNQVGIGLADEDVFALFSENYHTFSRLRQNSYGKVEDIFQSAEFPYTQSIRIEISLESESKQLIFPYWADMEAAAKQNEGENRIMAVGNDRELNCQGREFIFFAYDLSQEQQLGLLDFADYSLRGDSELDMYDSRANNFYRDYPESSLADTVEFAKGIKNRKVGHRFGRQSQYIKKSVWDEVSYNKKLNPLADDADFLEDFLFRGKEGFCVHYATAATILFRMKNIPARYVTGYRLDPESYEQKEGESGEIYYEADVLDTNGHAWVEIYKPYLGWVPVEVTESVAGGEWIEVEEPEARQGQDVSAEEELPGEELEEKLEEEEDEYDEKLSDYRQETEWEEENNLVSEDTLEREVSEEDTKDEIVERGEGDAADVPDGSWKGIVVAAAICLTVIGILCFSVIYYRKRRQAAFERENYSRKILIQVNRIGRKIAWRKRRSIKKMSDGEVLKLLVRESKYRIQQEEITWLENILEKAAFAREVISEEEYRQAVGILERAGLG